MPTPEQDRYTDAKRANVPVLALIALAVFVIAGVVLALMSNPDNQVSTQGLMAIIVTSIPSLIGAIYAERVARDVRNGVLQQKVKDGAREALAEIHLHDGLPLHSHAPGDDDPVLKAHPHSH